ncbi:MAG: hypothetical protein JKY95_15990 [Planctomycetaceae bacterium]|nr:hypothetical protein [Planctomycetaceae bacterium]
MTKKFAWMAAGLLVMIAIAIFSVWLPAPLKKLGLFSCLLGAIVGMILWQLREKICSENQTGDSMFVLLLGGLAETVRIYESYRVHLTIQQQKLIEKMQEVPSILQPELTKNIQHSFSDFLLLRYSAISVGLDQKIGSWGIYGLLTVEIILAATAAWYAFRYFSIQNTQEQEPSEPTD